MKQREAPSRVPSLLDETMMKTRFRECGLVVKWLAPRLGLSVQLRRGDFAHLHALKFNLLSVESSKWPV